MDLPCDPAILFLGIHKKNPTTPNTNSKQYTYPYVHCSIIYSSQAIEAAQVPINRAVDKKAVLHMHNGILLGHKKE